MTEPAVDGLQAGVEIALAIALRRLTQ
ncbi:MAG: hypothetical protein QOH57_3984, partial [Mycobacterium sp.]|nr:hypothetical protein [Mycobacterium sp.]